MLQHVHFFKRNEVSQVWSEHEPARFIRLSHDNHSTQQNHNLKGWNEYLDTATPAKTGEHQSLIRRE